MGDSYYCRFPGDYRRDTGHLSLAEHGAYCLLLDAYYSTGRPLPASVEALVRIVGAQGKGEREAVESVANEFLPVGADGLRHQGKADREIARRELVAVEQSRRGKLGAEARWRSSSDDGTGHASSNTTSNGGGIKQAMLSDGPPAPAPHPTPEPTPAPAPRTPPACAREAGFSDFWKAYPRKVGKEAALRAWISKVVSGDAERIMGALAWQVECAEWKRDGGRYVPKPENYLWESRWLDERPRDPFLDGEEGAA